MSIKGGLITALITPFTEDEKVDFDSLKSLVRQQLAGGVDGFVISGTTAESPNLSLEEVKQIFSFVKSLVPKDFQMILGAGTNSTASTIQKIKSFEELEADAYLVVCPYYNKPTQEGLYQHFKAVAQATNKAILLYDVPGRTVVEISVETVKKLSEFKNIVGIKDATGDLIKLKSYKEVLPKDFLLLSGDDETTCDFVKSGGHGVISVLSHVIPQDFKKAMKGEEDFSKHLELCRLLFSEPNPTPVKEALYQMGVLRSRKMRLPLVEMTEKGADLLKSQLGVLNV